MLERTNHIGVIICLGAVAICHCGRPVGNTEDASSQNDSGPSACQTGSCDGCCDANDVCHPGINDDACGTSGNECADCQTLGGFCNAGNCEGTDPCGPENCGGCCSADGDCLSGSSDTACGSNGNSCLECNEQICQEGVCIHECIDLDGDGYGQYCPLGEDCDDTAPGIVGPCSTNPLCPQGWIYIDSGLFLTGCDEQAGQICGEFDIPIQQLHVDAFCVQETEVSVEKYRECELAGICAAPSPATVNPINCNWKEDHGDDRIDHPMNCLTWTKARAYCQSWMGGDLPTEWQWEKAARGTNGQTYPWGEDTPDCTRCNGDLCFGDPPVTWPVGHLIGPEGDSPDGLKDTCGNVAEMTLSSLHNVFSDVDPSVSGDFAVVRGGDYGIIAEGLSSDLLTTYSRFNEHIAPMPAENMRSPLWGFRCVRFPQQQ